MFDVYNIYNYKSMDIVILYSLSRQTVALFSCFCFDFLDLDQTGILYV